MRVTGLVLTTLAVLGLITGVATVAMAEILENTHDAYVARDNAGLNDNSSFGASNKVYVKADGGNVVNKSYHKWDLSSITTARTSVVFEITQALTYGAPEGQPAFWQTLVYALDDNATGQDWNESTLTYNNAPGNLNSPGVSGWPATEFYDDEVTTYVGSFDFDVFSPAGTVYSFSTPALLAAVNGDTDNSLTLMLRTSILSGGGQHLASKEHVSYQGARLNFDASIPTPTSTWNVDASGLWGTAGNWLPIGVPNSNSAVVGFGDKISVPRTVTNNAAVTVHGMVFGEIDVNASITPSYTIAGSGSVTLVSQLDESNSTILPQIGVVEGSHVITVDMYLNDSASVNAEAGSSLTLNNAFNLNGNTLTATGAGTVNINGTVTTIGGSVVAASGVVGGTGTVTGDLTNNGGTVSPGLSPGTLNVTGDYNQTAGSLLIEIDGLTPDTQYDVLNVTGDLTISGGSLDVVLGFSPQMGDTFDILNFTTADLNTSLFTLNLESPGPTLDWDTSALDINGTLKVVTLIDLGDFDQNGSVGLEDYAIMEANWEATGQIFNLTGDVASPGGQGFGFGDGIVNIYDFEHFREDLFPGGASAFAAALASAVPEPSAFMLLLAAVPALLVSRVRSGKEEV